MLGLEPKYLTVAITVGIHCATRAALIDINLNNVKTQRRIRIPKDYVISNRVIFMSAPDQLFINQIITFLIKKKEREFDAIGESIVIRIFIVKEIS